MAELIEGDVIDVNPSKSNPHLDTIEVAFKLSGKERRALLHVRRGTHANGQHVVLSYNPDAVSPITLA